MSAKVLQQNLFTFYDIYIKTSIEPLSLMSASVFTFYDIYIKT